MTTRLPGPISRREQQRLTREALIFAARRVFARDGFHGANLEVIAREAGFSKGAVYSNFDNKAALFLAVMDLQGRSTREEFRDADTGAEVDPYSREDRERLASGGDDDEASFDQVSRGFALATLEFIAVAARDEALAQESAKRVGLLVRGYARVAEGVGGDDELTGEERGLLMAALDQGSGLLALAGNVALSGRALQVGMRRILGAAEGEAPWGGDGAGLYDDIRDHITASFQGEADTDPAG